MSTDQETVVTPSFQAQVWNTLSRIDVGDYIETKGGNSYKLSYLSWTFAWAQLMNHYPKSEFWFNENTVEADGSVSVNVAVMVSEDKERLRRDMWLPVMDNKNQAVVNPNSRQISDTRMRCLVKCLALFGLGLDVYAGSDRPMGTLEDCIDTDQAEIIQALLEASKSDIPKFLKWLKIESIDQVPAGKFDIARQTLENKIRRNKGEES